MSIYKKLLAIASEAENIEKKLKVGFSQTGSYKAVAEADVLAEFKPLLKEHGVYGFPISREIVDQQIVESLDRDGKPKLRWYMRIKTVYRFVDVDTGEFIETISFGDGLDEGDKAPGKAMTYSDKYALLKAFQTITGDDPDQNASEPSYRPYGVAGQQPPRDTPREECAYEKPAEKKEPQASERQRNLISKLLIERNVSIEAFGFKGTDNITQRQASDLLDKLIRMKPAPKQEQPKPVQEEVQDDDFPF